AGAPCLGSRRRSGRARLATKAIVGRRRKVPGRHTRPDAHPVRRATPRRGLQSSPGENLLSLSDAGTALCRRARDVRRSARRIIRRIEPGAELIAALFLSLGLWAWSGGDLGIDFG